MRIRQAQKSELDDVKSLVDSFEELDTDESTYTMDYLESLRENHLLLVAVPESGSNTVIGTCFGKYNQDEDWADMIGLAVEKQRQGEGIGTALVNRFEEEIAEYDISTIDLFADRSRRSFFEHLGYEEGRTYVAFRKHL